MMSDDFDNFSEVSLFQRREKRKNEKVQKNMCVSRKIECRKVLVDLS